MPPPKALIKAASTFIFNFVAILFNLLFDQSLTDLHTGTKVIKKDLIDKLNLTLNGFGLEIDMSSQIAKKNLKFLGHKVELFNEKSEDCFEGILTKLKNFLI